MYTLIGAALFIGAILYVFESLMPIIVISVIGAVVIAICNSAPKENNSNKRALNLKVNTTGTPDLRIKSVSVNNTKQLTYIPDKKEPVALTFEMQNANKKIDELIKDESVSVRPQEWNISISFSRSRSSNFERAMYLAKHAPIYNESSDGKNEIFQATYSSSASDYLDFIKLYELSSNWKSTHVAICGELVDRKIVGQLNFCYGDKCRSGNPEFCNGASIMTVNPFGCHRLQISASSNPWVSFFVPLDDGRYYLDKKCMKQRIDSYASVYRLCPSFDYIKILKILSELPNIVTKKEYLNFLTVEFN
ncbi:hypothetical protein [Synergistes jonesii]|uniref:Uncharacterized protein n=1 Tax=Synergistes jonesii TaxID=2754 RepID=A0A073IQ68_9BACT|nr:hypothetical protein [Synergistes jonesii]KEJ91735.1 hypothetical protein EH55_07105 [Synergistes jonesii]OFB61801.1 hypothetical protein JS73_09230 [Synergistes jonesii]OFB64108.1 hypothetical protein JS72_05235 [Synergistes jonesii]OFB67302.1 hypothetical protein JS78_09240 [Synergistes jonesii]OFB69203.1 hypothetical protein JS77_09250 [Synergistes jonesii]